jgi:hypothetical protein
LLVTLAIELWHWNLLMMNNKLLKQNLNNPIRKLFYKKLILTMSLDNRCPSGLVDDKKSAKTIPVQW